MPRNNAIGIDVELPGTLSVNDPLFVSLLNERLRRLAGRVDEQSGSKGAIKFSAAIDMQGHPITNLGTAKDGKDAVSLQQGNRRWLINPSVGVQANVAVTITRLRSAWVWARRSKWATISPITT